MDYNTLRIKPTINLPCDYDEEAERNGKVTCKDLLSSTLTGIFTEIELPLNAITVNKYYVARPDLISLAVYGSDEYGDIICKFNGISNPFELNENMIIYLPSRYDIDKMINRSMEGPSEIIKSDSSIKKKISSFTKKKTDYRSPSMAVVGDNNYVIDKSLGLVFY